MSATVAMIHEAYQPCSLIKSSFFFFFLDVTEIDLRDFKLYSFNGTKKDDPVRAVNIFGLEFLADGSDFVGNWTMKTSFKKGTHVHGTLHIKLHKGNQRLEQQH